MNDELHPCRKCGEAQVIRDGEEDTGFCDGCAQDMIEDLVEFVRFAVVHKGSCKPRAKQILKKFGLKITHD